MRQSSRVEPSHPSAPAVGLHPALSSALANLDIQLEDELVRYRRQRTVGRVVPQSGRKQAPNHLDLIAVSAADARSSEAVLPASALEERLTGVADPTIAPDAYKPIPAFTANPQPFDAAIALRTAKTPLPYDGASGKATLSASDDAHALAQANTPNLDDYLESSEELLRSLADEQAEAQAERSFMQSLLTPLGLGSMLLLLLSSAMFGYVIMNPSSLGWLTAQRNAPTASPGQSPGAAVIPPVQPNLPNAQLPVIDPNNPSLGTLNPRTPSPATSASPQTAVTPQSKPTIAAAKASALGQPSSESSSTSTQAPIPAVTSSATKPYPVQPSRAPQAAAPSRPVPTRASITTNRPAPTTGNTPAASNSASGSGSYQYKVGIPFENDQTLENARKVVPDAFVRTLPDGRTIVQVGAAQSEAEVKASMQGLRDRGLSSTEVYKR
ncbi:MAG: hypothetical protein H7Z11_16465 [Verrucomicrobia bacterium]|nr:hypothetical protein [Leptolyngbya sp. ES-bin-22]